MPTGKPRKYKPCAICGELFVPEKPSTRICNKDHYVNCPICGKQMIWNSRSEIQPCSKECKKEATRRLNQEKYGVDHPMQSKSVQLNHRRSMREKYGVDSPLQLEEIKEKAIQTNLERYGAEWALSNEDVRNKIKLTNLDKYNCESPLGNQHIQEKGRHTVYEKYGVEHVMQLDSIRTKQQQTLLDHHGVDNPMKSSEIAEKSVQTKLNHREEIIDNIKSAFTNKYGVDNPMKVPEIVDKIGETMLKRYGVKAAIQLPEFRQKMIDTMISKYGTPYYVLSDEYDSSSHNNYISKLNKRFGQFLSDNEIQFEYEFKIGLKSYDFHILDTNILIELDPTYTHNIIGNHFGEGISVDYHLDKSKLAEANGYRCIHVFDWDNWEKILQLVKQCNQIYARNCQIFYIKKQFGDQFLRDNHIQGTCRGQSLMLGLVYNNELYQLMTFGQSRYDKTHNVELLRLCTKRGYKVIGGASKLMKEAVTNFELTDIVSYCDISKFTGDVYSKIGMKLIRETQPQEIWSKNNSRITANLLRQRGYDQLFNTNYGKGENNDNLMIKNGWLPVYDCGQRVYEFKQ